MNETTSCHIKKPIETQNEILKWPWWYSVCTYLPFVNKHNQQQWPQSILLWSTNNTEKKSTSIFLAALSNTKCPINSLTKMIWMLISKDGKISNTSKQTIKFHGLC